MKRLGYAHDMTLVKAFMLRTPCCEQLGHDLVCADQIMTAVEIKAEAITKLAKENNDSLPRNPEIVRVAAGMGSAEDYKIALLRFNGYIFGSWEAMLNHAVKIEPADKDKNSARTPEKIRFDCERYLENMIGKNVFQLPCGYWVEFI